MGATITRATGRLTSADTIVLDRRLPFRLGEVLVTIEEPADEPAALPPQPNDIMSVLARIAQQRQAMGYVAPTAEQVDAYINELRDSDEEHLLELERMQEEAARCRGEQAA